MQHTYATRDRGLLRRNRGGAGGKEVEEVGGWEGRAGGEDVPPDEQDPSEQPNRTVDGIPPTPRNNVYAPTRIAHQLGGIMHHYVYVPTRIATPRNHAPLCICTNQSRVPTPRNHVPFSHSARLSINDIYTF